MGLWNDLEPVEIEIYHPGMEIDKELCYEICICQIVDVNIITILSVLLFFKYCASINSSLSIVESIIFLCNTWMQVAKRSN